MSTAFALASAVSFDQTTNAVAFISQVDMSAASVRAVAGRTLSILQWLVLGCLVLFGLGVSSIFAKEGGTIYSTGPAKVGSTTGYNTSSLLVVSLPPPPPHPPPPPLLPVPAAF
jgi:hypothetical protein